MVKPADTNRPQPVKDLALRAAEDVLLDQSTLHVDVETFRKIIDWMDATPTRAETDGMTRLLRSEAPWPEALRRT